MSFTIFQNEKAHFQTIKTRSSKGQKIDVLPKGLSHGFGPKMAIFPTYFFWQYRPGKCLLRYSRTKKTAFWGIKSRSSKSRKIDIFPKRLTHGFGPKMAIFPIFFYQAIYAGKTSFMIFQNEKTPFQAIKTRSPKSPKIDIFPKGLTYGFGPKMAISPTFLREAILARKMSFTIFQNEKTPFEGIKTTSSKSRKIEIFPKGLTHGFSPQMAIFASFLFLGNIAQENDFMIFQKEKTPYQAIISKS